MRFLCRPINFLHLFFFIIEPTKSVSSLKTEILRPELSGFLLSGCNSKIRVF